MIGIAILVGVFFYFFRTAKDTGENKWIWGIVGIVTYFLSQTISVIAISVFFPYYFQEDDIALFIISVVSSILGCMGMHYLLRQQIKKKQEAKDQIELLDDNL